MKSGHLNIVQLLLPLAFIIGGFLVGLGFKAIILTKFKRMAERKKWKGYEIILSSTRGTIILFFGIAGIYGALYLLPISATLLSIFQKILTVIVIFLVTLVLARLAAGLFNLYTTEIKEILPRVSILTNLIKLLIFVVGILIILHFLGISITPILTALGIGGLAVALALQDTLSNLFAGLHIITSRAIKLGDYVKLDTGEEGYVTDITWRNTTIRELPNNIIVIPNSKLATAIVKNYCQPVTEMAVSVEVRVSYESDLKKVEKVTIEVAKEVMRKVQGGVPEFEPFIRYHTFGDFSINFTVILCAKTFVDQYLIKHEFVKRLHERYSKEGIVIPFPTRIVYMEKEEK